MAVISPPWAAAGLVADRPPIAALFLIEFDVKAGYTIAWKQAARGLDLSGAVEYKSLPSGLHAVSEDLIYFVHEDGANEAGADTDGDADGDADAGEDESLRRTGGGYAGLSAFVNLPTNEADARFARMIAVGVLVPRRFGRLGRAWRHAEALLTMARTLAADGNETPLLEAYWQEHSASAGTAGATESGGGAGADADADRPPLLQIVDSPLTSPTTGFRPSLSMSAGSLPDPESMRARSAADGTASLLPPGHRLSPHHPAWSLTALLSTFGPLVFPLYRAALLRQRILISAHAPVREVNNFVYNLSVLANIPASVLDLLEPAAVARQRIRPLFTIGVNDIPFLMQDAAAKSKSAASGGLGGPGWIACTTDSILAMKGELWDVLVTMPSAHAAHAKEKVWPVVEVAKGVPLQATQRDLRRFRALSAGLARLAGGPPLPDMLVEAADAVVEPVTWAALAYNGFMWWASAGEQRRAEEEEECVYDAALLADLAVPAVPSRPTGSSSAMHDSLSSLTARQAPAEGDVGEMAEAVAAAGDDEDRARVELAIITYFHRLTAQMLSVVGSLAESSGHDDSDGTDEELLLRPTACSSTDAAAQLGHGTPVRVSSDALERMGLDVWSPADAAFVRDVALQYFGCGSVQVDGKGVEVCGLKVC